MKKFLLAAATLLVGAFALTSCSSGSPKASADKFLTSFYHMDYEDAKKYATDETKKQLDMMNQLSGMMGDTAKQQAKKTKVDIKDVKEEGDNATVTYTLSNGQQTAPGTMTLKMIKKSGKWLASWTKQDMMGGGAAGGEAPAGQPMDNGAGMGADTSMMNGTAPADGTVVDTTSAGAVR
jgi:ABC-type oligopeptide transport system substrate-binding subunit